MKLGLFVKDNEGIYCGRVFLLGFPAIPLRLKPAKSNSGTPYYKAMTRDGAQEVEIGSAFENISKSGNPYLKVILDSPSLAAPVIGYMHHDKITDVYDLIWTRPSDEAGSAIKPPQSQARTEQAALAL